MKLEFINTGLPIINQYVSDNHGWSAKAFEHEAGKEYIKAMEAIREFDGHKVELTFNYERDFASVNNGTKKGRIKIVDDRVRFYEGRKTSRFYYLDAGVYSGFFATLIPTKIVSN